MPPKSAEAGAAAAADTEGAKAGKPNYPHGKPILPKGLEKCTCVHRRGVAPDFAQMYVVEIMHVFVRHGQVIDPVMELLCECNICNGAVQLGVPMMVDGQPNPAVDGILNAIDMVEADNKPDTPNQNSQPDPNTTA